jgi:hypothetical protein
MCCSRILTELRSSNQRFNLEIYIFPSEPCTPAVSCWCSAVCSWWLSRISRHPRPEPNLHLEVMEKRAGDAVPRVLNMSDSTAHRTAERHRSEIKIRPHWLGAISWQRFEARHTAFLLPSVIYSVARALSSANLSVRLCWSEHSSHYRPCAASSRASRSTCGREKTPSAHLAPSPHQMPSHQVQASSAPSWLIWSSPLYLLGLEIVVRRPRSLLHARCSENAKRDAMRIIYLWTNSRFMMAGCHISYWHAPHCSVLRAYIPPHGYWRTTERHDTILVLRHISASCHNR